MTTPALNNIDTAFSTVRYFTQYDPYFYTVDNRPLTDMTANDEVLAQGGDAARRAILLEALGRATSIQGQYGNQNYITGLGLSLPSANTVQVDIGSLFTPMTINAGTAGTVMKQAINWQPKSFAIPAPTALGNNVVYTIAGQYVDFGANTSAGFPYFDKNNTRLAETVLHGELQLQIYAGSQAVAGSEIPPLIPSGWVPLYNITVPYGNTTWSKALYSAGAPASYGLWHPVHTFRPTTANGATTGSLGDMSAYQFADGSSQFLNITIPVQPGAINPYKPVKLKLFYGANAAGNIAFRLNYQTLSSGSSITPSYTQSGIDYLPYATVNNAYSFDTLNAVIPGSVAASASVISVNLERVGADSGDANTGVFSIIRATAFQ